MGSSIFHCSSRYYTEITPDSFSGYEYSLSRSSRDTCFLDFSDTTWVPKPRTDSLPTKNQPGENKPVSGESDGQRGSVSNSVDTDHQVDPRRVSKEFREHLRSSDLAEDTSQFHPDGDRTLEEELEETSVGKLLLTNLSENLAEAASQATSTLSDFIDMQKNMVNKSKGFARKVVSELKQDTRHSSSEAPVSSSVTEQSPKKRAGFFATSKNLFGFAQNTTRNNSAVQEGSVTPAYHTSPDQRYACKRLN
ncbi:hypothetical protein FGIG_08221 [Fasciola gigantica]|uniref:Uncharacterized protein n=1 Tax=Fasciola gigantica TaxID=46835 RepID=A0A504YTU9_FASGI|nr:hypothetical protein FGIG_08221 [Fasciola gigantica]